MDEIKVGDVVLLKSGGVRMTVVQVNQDGTYACHWFDKDMNLRATTYPASCLRVLPPDVS